MARLVEQKLDALWLSLLPELLDKKLGYSASAQLDRVTSTTSSLGLALFYLANALYGCGCNPTMQRGLHAARHSRSAWPHVVFALLYFALRGLLWNVWLSTDMGLVPFVGWISVYRICKLPDFSAFPACAAQPTPPTSTRTTLILFAQGLTTVLDAAAILLVLAEAKATRRSFSQVAFTRARQAPRLPALGHPHLDLSRGRLDSQSRLLLLYQPAHRLQRR